MEYFIDKILMEREEFVEQMLSSNSSEVVFSSDGEDRRIYGVWYTQGENKLLTLKKNLLSLAKSIEKVGDVNLGITYRTNSKTENLAYNLDINSLNDNIIPILSPSYPTFEIKDGILIFDINADASSIDELLSFYCKNVELKKENDTIILEKNK